MGAKSIIALSAAMLAGLGEAHGAVPDFETEVLPVLTKSGCNSGSCHGAAIGRGGFRLSLLGYDPDADYEALRDEHKGRRLNLAHPEKSLLLKKPSRQLPHDGGRRLPVDSDGYRRVLEWIQAGAPRGPGRRLQRLEIRPAVVLLDKVDDVFQVQTIAHFSDGGKEDVTRWTVFTPADPASVSCDPKGKITVHRRGRHAVMVRFLGEVGSVVATVPVNDQLPPARRPRRNYIDDHVGRALDELRLPQSPRCDDATFVRRIYLDLLGVLPDPKEVEAFVGDAAADKRQQLIDALMKRPEFIDHWAYFWGDILRIESRRLNPEGAAAFHLWLREQLENNRPYDEWVRELLLAVGDGFKVGPANFSRVPVDARSHAEYVSQAFLGVRLQCANCHNHPLDRWTQDDYHGMSAIFARIGRGREVRLLERGEVVHPRTGQAARPKLPGVGFIADDAEPRQRFADWLTAKDNPYFAHALVNRLWKQFMGRGLVEPVDDFRATNPATHPVLLDALAEDFVRSGFDVRHVMRMIVLSEAYQRSSLSVAGNQADDRFYSKALVRPLPPHVHVDAVSQVTSVPEQFGGQRAGVRAGQLGDSRAASLPLDLLGRCPRDGGCGVGGSFAVTLPLVLHAINGQWLNAKVADPRGRLGRLLQEKKSDAEIVTDFYRRAFARPPTEAELAYWTRQFSRLEGDKRRAAFEDFLWALLNSTEFTTNH